MTDLPKGKPWTNDEEKQLRDLIAQDKTVNHIAEMMHKSHQAIMRKVERLGIEVVGQTRMQNPTSSNLVLPDELPSVEEALKILCTALTALQQGGLDQAEVLRLYLLASVPNLGISVSIL